MLQTMTRPLRLEFPNALYHITPRGDRRATQRPENGAHCRLQNRCVQPTRNRGVLSIVSNERWLGLLFAELGILCYGPDSDLVTPIFRSQCFSRAVARRNKLPLTSLYKLAIVKRNKRAMRRDCLWQLRMKSWPNH